MLTVALAISVTCTSDGKASRQVCGPRDCKQGLLCTHLWPPEGSRTPGLSASNTYLHTHTRALMGAHPAVLPLHLCHCHGNVGSCLFTAVVGTQQGWKLAA